MARTKMAAACAGAALLTAGFVTMRAQDPAPGETPEIAQSIAPVLELPVSDATCPFFGPEREKYQEGIRAIRRLGALTAGVAAKLALQPEATATALIASAPGGSRTDTLSHSTNTIDKYIFPALAQAGVAAAPPTTDFEFIRRAYLDLTGHIPSPSAVVTFV